MSSSSEEVLKDGPKEFRVAEALFETGGPPEAGRSARRRARGAARPIALALLLLLGFAAWPAQIDGREDRRRGSSARQDARLAHVAHDWRRRSLLPPSANS